MCPILRDVQPMVVLNYPGVEVVGPLPAELQNTSDFVFTAGIVVNTRQSAAADAFIKFLLTPAAESVIKAKGMEPGKE